MPEASDFDAWTAGRSYDAFMGHWSRRVAAGFTAWLAPPRDADWVEVGCGTGALTEAILATCAPRTLLAVDASEGFIAHARAAISDPRVRFETADATRLPAEPGSLDVAASALVLNFLAAPLAGVSEMRRVLKPGGLLAFYVWDYPGGGMQLLDAFWKAAAECSGRGDLNEAGRFAFCTRDGVAELCAAAGLQTVAVEPITVEASFPSFDEVWHPFTLGAGPAPGYVASLEPTARAALREAFARRLGPGPVTLTARAWAARGINPWV
jgi:SAM-dependent methyltransferase